MSGKKYEDRTTEEIRAINDIDLLNNEKSQKNKYKTPFIIVAVSFVLLLILISINYLRNPYGNNGQTVDKDEALRYAWESSELKFEYDGKDLSVENLEEIFTLLESDTWMATNASVAEDESPECVMRLATDYSIEFYREIVAVKKGNAEKRYKLRPDIPETLCVYLEENTYISVGDVTSLLSISENLTLNISGISCVTGKGQTIANALNTSTWVDSIPVETSSEAFLEISDPIGLTVKIFENEKIAIVTYKGNERYYTIDELVPASVALAAKSVFDAEAVKIGTAMEECENLIVVVDGNSYRTDANSAWTSAVDFGSWTRRYKAPAAVPENADITIFDDISFILKIYEDLLVAEYENSYYNIPDTVISSVKSYLTVASPDEEEEVTVNKFTVSEFVKHIMKQEHLHSAFFGKTTLTSVSNELISALGINSWKDAEAVNDTYDIMITTDAELKDGGFAIGINTVSGKACIQWGEFVQYYSTPADMSAVSRYIQNNVYTEVWQVSATELGTLQNASTAIDTVVTDENSEKRSLSSESIGVADIIKVSASLNLTPVENKPDADGSKKTEMTFKTDTNKFLVTYYETAVKELVVSVSGTLSDIGKRIERCFVADGTTYSDFVGKIDGLIEQTYDIVAGTFVESIKSMNAAALNELTGNVFDYSDLVNVRFNNITFEKTDAVGKYRVKLNVAEPMEGPFEAGESSYILVIGSIDDSFNLKVKSFTEESEYNKADISHHDAVSVARYFASWYIAEDPYFESFGVAASKKSAVDFLMRLALAEELNTVVESDPMGMYFTQDTISKMALKYFNVSDFDAKDTSAYNSETGLYAYTNAVVPVDLKKVVDFSEDPSNNRYYVTVSWYEDPMYLYEIKTVVYTLDKSGEGVYRILSATDSLPEASADENEVEGGNTETEQGSAETEDRVDNAQPEDNTNGNNNGDGSSQEGSDNEGSEEADSESDKEQDEGGNGDE